MFMHFGLNLHARFSQKGKRFAWHDGAKVELKTSAEKFAKMQG